MFKVNHVKLLQHASSRFTTISMVYLLNFYNTMLDIGEIFVVFVFVAVAVVSVVAAPENAVAVADAYVKTVGWYTRTCNLEFILTNDKLFCISVGSYSLHNLLKDSLNKV